MQFIMGNFFTLLGTDKLTAHKIVSENIDNTQHNYELIYELKDQLEELKQEINALKLIQIVSLKKGKQEQCKKTS